MMNPSMISVSYSSNCTSFSLVAEMACTCAAVAYFTYLEDCGDQEGKCQLERNCRYYEVAGVGDHS